MRDIKRVIEEDLNIIPGTGATCTSGSDAYPYYVSEVLPKGVIGMYSPSWQFAKSWTDGTGKVDAFDSSHKTDFFIKRRYGKWWTVDCNGKPIEKFAGRNLAFGHACAYQDPSF